MFALLFQERGVPKRHALQPGPTLVGRAPTCALAIDDASVSRQQARITVKGNTCRLADAGSRNGTYLNGQPVVGEVEVNDGDTITFGRLPAKVEHTAEGQILLGDDRELVESAPSVYLERGRDPLSRAGAPRQPFDVERLLAMIAEVSRMLARPPSLPRFLNRIVELIFDAVPAERGFLLLHDAATGGLVPRVVRVRQGTAIGTPTVSRTIVNRVMADRVAILAQDAQIDTRLANAESVALGNIRSFMCAPLWNLDEVLGVLYVDAPRIHEFTATDLELFAAMSDYAAVAIAHVRLAARVLDETRQRERLQRYHSPAVVEKILRGSDESAIFLAAHERDVTVLFADIVGFSTMSEAMTPLEVTRLLNRYFDVMSEVVFEHEGTLDKFIGDALLAVFGAPLDQPDHPIRAVRTAQAMQKALDEFNRQDPASPLQIRIGINSGSVTAGDIGSPRRREYTVLGDTVNTAARLQTSVCKPGQTVISRAVLDRLGGAVPVTPLGFFRVKGRNREIEAFAV